MTQFTNPEDFATMSDGQTLVIQRWLPGTAARLWTYLVDADLRKKWFADGAMTLKPGAALELVWRNDQLSKPGDPKPPGAGGEQRMQSHVIEASAPTRLVIGWGTGTVTFDLHEVDGKVRLTITHTGLDATQLGVFAGWHSHLDILAALAADQPAPSFWTGWTAARAQYIDRLSGKATATG